MVDSSKRRSLKSIGAMAALPLVPTLLMPATSQAKAIDANTALNAVSGNEQLNISLELGDTPSMRVTNNSDSLTILRRIHPGVVHAGSKSYDLNHSLNSSSYAIGAGSSRLIPIVEAHSAVAEPALPASYGQKPLRVAAITSDNTSGRTLNASRAFFA